MSRVATTGSRQPVERRPRQTHPKRSGFDNPDGLTPRQLEVLRLVASGSPNKHIAPALDITIHTVEKHVANIHKKTGVRGPAHAVLYAMLIGLLDNTPDALEQAHLKLRSA